MTRLLTSKYISVGVTYISWFSDFALYLECYLLDKCHTWDISSMWPNEWPLTISRSLWPIFHGSVILPYILNTICWINVTPGILVPCDPMNDHLLYLGHLTYISWFSDFALYLEYYLLDKCQTWDISSLWPDYWRQNISLLVWPIFHGSVILPYILNTICWINVTPGILVPCDPMNDHLLYLGHCDLYFMLQWFCLLFLLLFHRELSYLDYYIYVTKWFTYKYI